MTREDDAPDDGVTGGSVDLRRIPIRAQLLFTFATGLANGRRVAFGASQLAALIQVPTKHVFQVLTEQIGVAHHSPPRTRGLFPHCIVEVYGCAIHHVMGTLRTPPDFSGQRYRDLLPHLPPLPWYAYVDVEQVFGVRGLSALSIPPFQNLHRQRWESLRRQPDANER